MAKPVGFINSVMNGFTVKFDVTLYSETGTFWPRWPLNVT
jgi:hypothetical protein